MRKKIVSVFFILILLLSAGASHLFSLEITGMFHLGNLSFDQDATSLETALSGESFPYGFSLYASEKINDSIHLKAGVLYDPILRYTTYTLFEYRQDYLVLSVGPFFGTFNTPGSILQSGISTEVTAQLPGRLYATLRSDSSIGARFSRDGDYLQELNQLSVGYYIPNAICSVNIGTKSFISRKSSVLEIDDSLTNYSFSVDIFEKNVLFGILLTFGYQQLSRTYIDTSVSPNTSDVNTLNSIVLGTNFSFQASSRLKVLVDLESNVYSFGSSKADGSSASSLGLPEELPQAYLFRTAVGFSWTF
jgi:hypothetical protein